MQLRIEGNNLTRNFAQWMLQITKNELNMSLDKKRFTAVMDPILQDLNTNISIDVFWKQSLAALTYDFVDDTLIVIHFDLNKYLVDNIKIETLCKLINFGTIERKGYPIYTDTFHKIASEIDTHIKLYKLVGG